MTAAFSVAFRNLSFRRDSWTSLGMVMVLCRRSEGERKSQAGCAQRVEASKAGRTHGHGNVRAEGDG